MDFELKNDVLQLKCRSFGGELKSIQNRDGLEYLWQGDAKYWAGQAPVLFPICGNVRNGQVKYHIKNGEQTGQLPRHGLIRKREFQLKEHSANRLVFAITSNPESLRSYPFHFRVEIAYELSGKEVSTTYRVQNLELEQVMPYCIGVIQPSVARF